MQWANHIQSSSKFPLFLWVYRTFAIVYVGKAECFIFPRSLISKLLNALKWSVM